MSLTNFWDDSKKSSEIIEQLNSLKSVVKNIEDLLYKVNDIKDSLNSLDDNDNEFLKLLEDEYLEVSLSLEKLELLFLLDGEFDKNNCVLEVHSGAGGTEACDWAFMLYRMYTRWCDKNGYKYTILDYQEGEEVGIKSVSILVKGLYAYGYLKCEKGIHRLVRLSPFDANHKRHTSFASVLVTPEFNDDVNIEINDKDLKIDVYRSSGCGGQGVNTTDSAVRITHLPTKIVVTCQNERSQIQNKEQAMKVLKTRLYELQEQERLEKEGNERRSKIGTGDRAEKIRTYNYPQNRVTDHRIGFTTNNLDRVIDGYLDDIIDALIQEDQKRKLQGETE